MNTWQNEYWEQRFKKEGRVPVGYCKTRAGIRPLPAWSERKNMRTDSEGYLVGPGVEEPEPKELVKPPVTSGPGYFNAKGESEKLADYKEKVKNYANEWRIRDRKMKEPF